jgi:hypothetical protein
MLEEQRAKKEADKKQAEIVASGEAQVVDSSAPW